MLLSLYFTSCDQSGGSESKKETWAVIINFFSPDTAYYPDIKNFPFPDSLRFESIESYFTNQNKAPIISDSMIVFDDNYRENGKRVCCIKDTLEKYIDTIQGKKYLFAIGEYISAFQSNNNADTNLHPRKPISIPLWGIQLNTPYPPQRFKNEYEKLGAKRVKIDPRIDEITRQTWNDNDSVLVETIQFDNSTDRVITAVHKEMNKNEVDSAIGYLKNSFPAITHQEAIQKSSSGKLIKVIRMNFKGIAVSFTQDSETVYSFVITDYYETLKLIIKNAGTRYTFRDDINIY